MPASPPLLRSLVSIGLGACLALAAPSIGGAAPPGINLSWSDCGSFGQDARVFTCDTNVGSHTLIGSFSSPVALDSLNGNEVVIDIQGAAPTFAPWWQIMNYTNGAVGCRGAGSPAGWVTFDFTAGPFHCHDYWQGLAAGGLAMMAINGIQNRQRILIVSGIAAPVPVAPEIEAYSFRLNISNSKTVGAGACAGCLEQADIWLQSIKLTLPYNPVETRDVMLDMPSTRNYVLWRPGVVAVRNASWGAVKSLYR